MIPGAGRSSSSGEVGLVVRELHVVRLSPDGRALLLGATRDGRPTHTLPADDRLARALRGEDPDGVAAAPAPISPRDIQARLRAGATVEEVAAAAGVPVGRVERFAGPVRSEIEQVVAAAQRAVLRRARVGRSELPLRAAVETNLGLVAGVRPEDASWQAARQADGRWVVSVQVSVRARLRTARWRYAAGDREVTSLDAYASQLGFVAAATTKASTAKAPPATATTAKTAPATAGKAASAKRAATKTTVAKRGRPSKPTVTSVPSPRSSRRR